MKNKMINLALALAISTNGLTFSVSRADDNPKYDIRVSGNEIYVTIEPTEAEKQIYERYVMTGLVRNDNPALIVEAVRGYRQGLELHVDDITPVMGVGLDKFKIASATLGMTSDLTALGAGIAGTAAVAGTGGLGLIPLALAAGATSLKVLKDGIEIGSQMYDIGQFERRKSMSIVDASAQLRHEVDLCEAEFHGCKRTLFGAIDGRVGVPVSKGDSLPEVESALELRKMNRNMAVSLTNQIEGLKYLKALNERARRESASRSHAQEAQAQANKTQVAYERERLDDEILHTEMQNYFELAGHFVGSDMQDQRRFASVAHMVLGLHSLDLAQKGMVAAAQKVSGEMSVAEGAKYLNAAESSISFNFYFSCALLVYNTYSAWQSSAGEASALEAIGRQLEILDQKVTALIHITVENFADIKKMLNTLEYRVDQNLWVTTKIGVQNSPLLKSVAHADDTRRALIEQLVGGLYQSGRNVNQNQITSTANNLAISIGRAQVNIGDAAHIFANIEFESNGRARSQSGAESDKVAQVIALLMPDSNLITSEQRLFNQPLFLSNMAGQIFSFYLNNPMSDKNNANAKNVLATSLQSLQPLLRTDVLPNLDVWHKYVEWIVRYTKEKPNGVSIELLDRAKEMGQSIQGFYDRTTGSSYFQAALRYSLLRSLRDVVNARNDLWSYALNSYTNHYGPSSPGDDGASNVDPSDIINFEKRDANAKEIAPFYPACDGEIGMFQINSDLQKRVGAATKEFDGLKPFQLLSLMRQDRNGKSGFFACTTRAFNGGFSLDIGYQDEATDRILSNQSGLNIYRLNLEFRGLPTLQSISRGGPEYQEMLATPAWDGRLFFGNRGMGGQVRWMSHLYQKYFGTKSISQNLLAGSDAGKLNLAKVTNYAYSSFANLIAAGMPQLDHGVYLRFKGPTADNSLNSALARAKATAYYNALDRYLLVYYTYSAFADLQNQVSGRYNAPCSAALHLNSSVDGVSEKSIEPSSLLELLKRPVETIDIRPLSDTFSKASFDSSRKFDKFVCLDPGPLAIKASLSALDVIKARASKFWFQR